MNRRNLLARGVLAALTLALPMVPATAQQQPDMSRKAVTDDPVAPKRTRPGYDVTIVEFFDYNCGYCRHALSDMQTMLKKDKSVRFVLKEFPILGPESVAAHKVSDAFRKLAPEKYEQFHLALLGGEGRADEDSAMEVASSLGVNEKQIRDEMAKSPDTGSVQNAYDLAHGLLKAYLADRAWTGSGRVHPAGAGP